MAIQSHGEFEVLLANIIMMLDRLVDENRRAPALVSVRRQYGLLLDRMKRRVKLTPRELEELSVATETLRAYTKYDGDLSEQLYDVMDFAERA